MLAMIVIELFIRQSKLAFRQCNVSIFDRHFEERMNAKVDLQTIQLNELCL